MARSHEAGAVAVKLEGGEFVFLLVTARQDPAQWIFPKGHIEPGENAVAAALRELREEAGVEGDPIAELGTSSFRSGTEDVEVAYVLAKASGRGESSEGRQVTWLPYRDARTRLSFEDARQLLDRARDRLKGGTMNPAQDDGEAAAASRTARPWLRWLTVTVLGRARYERLEGELRVAEQELNHRIRANQGEHWPDAISGLLSQAKEALARGDLDQGWRLLHAAKRAEIHALEAPELASLASTIRSEADKLKSWRQKAIERLLGTSEKPVENLTVAAVYQAASLRDEHYGNQAYKDRLLKTQMLALVLTLGGVMLLLAMAANRTTTGAPSTAGTAPPGAQNASVVSSITVTPAVRGPRPLDPDQKIFIMVALFGVLGGTISAMLRASDTSQSARIPELTSAIRVTFMRILMGGASAVVIFVFLKSSLGSAISKQLFSDEIAAGVKELGLYTACAIAFVAGFSERLILRAVESVAGKADEKGGAKPTGGS